jgi:hypothetical protein
MDRQLFKHPSFTAHDIPLFPCPTCGKGTLVRVRDSLEHGLTAAAQRRRADPECEPEALEYTFVATLRCSNKSCHELVGVIGNGSPDYDEMYDDDGTPYTGLQDTFRPLYFHPHLILFQPPKETPTNVVKELNRSYQIFFCDPSAAANHVRSALECLLTELGVSRFQSTGKRRFLSLHDRILRMPKRYQAHSDLLLAVKWLGNAGSHRGLMKRDDVLDAYEIVEHLLSEIYESKASYVRTLAKKINKRRGPQN